MMSPFNSAKTKPKNPETVGRSSLCEYCGLKSHSTFRARRDCKEANG